MTKFRKYMHVERFGNDEVQGIELGKCYIFPKIDGTNASLWIDSETGQIQGGSRNRHLSLDNDNGGFLKWALNENEANAIFISNFFEDHPNYTLYGEWLIPHSLQTYTKDAWRQFYVFDVFDNSEQRYLSFDEYTPLIDCAGFKSIPPLVIIRNSNYEQFVTFLEKNVFLIKDGQGNGEGIVIKNYDYKNRFNRTCFAKIVCNEFKEKHIRKMGAAELSARKMTEEVFVNEVITTSLVEKTVAKIINDSNREDWCSKFVPQLLGRVFHDIVTEEVWNFTKRHKNPTINFRTLNTLTILKIKEIKPELF